jgi:hypothetical protein
MCVYLNFSIFWPVWVEFCAISPRDAVQEHEFGNPAQWRRPFLRGVNVVSSAFLRYLSDLRNIRCRSQHCDIDALRQIGALEVVLYWGTEMNSYPPYPQFLTDCVNFSIRYLNIMMLNIGGFRPMKGNITGVNWIIFTRLACNCVTLTKQGPAVKSLCAASCSGPTLGDVPSRNKGKADKWTDCAISVCLHLSDIVLGHMTYSLNIGVRPVAKFLIFCSAIWRMWQSARRERC